MARKLEGHPAHTGPSSLAYFQHAFSETDKLVFRGEEDDRESEILLTLGDCVTGYGPS